MGAPLLICTDLDRTLVPNGPQPESPGAREMVARLVAHPEVRLAFVTGRHRELVEQAIRDFALPVPDYVIGDVGTSVYRVGPEHLWQPDLDWIAAIETDWGGRTAVELEALVGETEGLRLQPEDRQNRFKLSYFSDLNLDIDAVTARIQERLERAGVRARLVWSVEERGDPGEHRGLLDILPASASKYHAIRALVASQGFTLGNTVFCGDSGNDLEVLASPVRSVLVANASEAVRKEAVRRAKEAGQADRLYLARGGFAGMNGNYAAGMLEGIAHFFPETVAWMAPEAEGAA